MRERERERDKENEKIILKNQRYLFSLLKKIKKKYPYLVVIVLHEYFRNLFPHDPHIKFKITNPKKRILDLQINLIEILRNFKSFGSYKIYFKNYNLNEEFKKKTGKVYGKFWKKFSNKENYNAKNFILDRFRHFKSFNNNFFKNKNIIDVGCGGGRYSNALRLLKAKSVVGVDYSNDGISTAKKNYKYKNITFKKRDVLNLKFKKNTFDIVFCNGVLHHTSDFKKGIKELYRICKPGGYIYLYLYGTGGLYWLARRKMNKLMKSIPQEYSQKVLDLIGMPSNRFIFMDNWYVPYERHCSHKEIYKILQSLGVKSIEKMKEGRKTDLETGLLNYKNSKIIWGEGEIRLLFQK
jgi:ubiquinone/menaquinone biosynthesis C-methylase UbiE